MNEIKHMANLLNEHDERVRFEKWYAANRMQLYMHLDQRLRLAIEDTARECWMEAVRQCAPHANALETAIRERDAARRFALETYNQFLEAAELCRRAVAIAEKSQEVTA